MVRIHVGEPLYFELLTRICMQIVYLCEKEICELLFLLNVHSSTRDLNSRSVPAVVLFTNPGSYLALPRLS